MRILGLSSATKVISIGLIDDDKVLIDQTFDDIHAEKIIYSFLGKQNAHIS